MRSYLRIFLMPFVGMLLFAFVPASKVGAQTATITTDKPDYMPGETVFIAGSGFASGETVTLQVLHYEVNGDNDTSSAHQPWDVEADASGNVSATWVVPLDQDEFGAILTLTADGKSSGLHAEIIFTDANCPSPTVSTPSNQTVCQTSGTATFSVTASVTGGGTLSYQWKNGNTILSDGLTVNGSTISGATTNTLTITNVQPGDAGNNAYKCDVTNTCGGGNTPRTNTSGGASLASGR